ncbi:GPR1/FUN34/yaaH family-domain-containing protein [Papiliotrema laurentii]|uniref:GPR1/FUN34/yaaH family-domain-containing protein n=1 Tax=Papiliotrema laurentii TaxID=5418 RepID=A0AAD9CXJ3_PAPLA|nr:GPR1/FUN34/yaaH family-domain-containing protein [Papiliotrema laurentii]
MSAPVNNTEHKVVPPSSRTSDVDGNGYSNGATGYQGTGGGVSRFITPGGNPIDTSQPAFPVYHRKFANPAPLGLLGFAATTFVLSFYNAHARSISTPNVVLGMALGYGGLVQLIAGVEEWACGNTFGATAFSSYGGFWFSFAALYIPQFEIAKAYASEREFANAVGIYLISWALITLIFLIASLRSSVALVSLFFMLHLTFWLLAAGELAPSPNCGKAGGITGVITAFIAMYTALAGMLTKDTSHFIVPVGDLSRAR